MSLGENINRLRTGSNMSQGDLAEALEVSRQSISKWETDASVPELDKLMKLAALFGVTLDELVTGRTPERPEGPEPEHGSVERPGTPVRKVVGTVLLCMAFAAAVLFAVVGRLMEGVVLSLPFLVCGTICLLAKKHSGLWCAWALFFMADLYLRYATGLSWATVRLTLLWESSWNYTRLVTAWCQLLCGLGLLAVTVVSLRKKPLEWTGKNKKRLLGVAALFLLLCLPVGAYFVSLGNLAVLVGWLRDSLRLALLTALLTMLLRGRRGGQMIV